MTQPWHDSGSMTPFGSLTLPATSPSPNVAGRFPGESGTEDTMNYLNDPPLRRL
jgi:hypothetical protein